MKAANVNSILACIAAICDGYNAVLFRQNGGVVIPEAELEIKDNNQSRVTHFGRKGNTYSMDAWVRKQRNKDAKMNVDSMESGFIRQGMIK